MTKNELAKELAVSEHLPISTAFQALDGIIRIISERLAAGEEVVIRDFLTLSVVRREAKTAYHFQTRQPISIPARNAVQFRLGRKLKELISGTDSSSRQTDNDA
ncbi:MAG: HU family DNA-binding protein [Prevotella sp.]|nr:HU family DNA-binding protein [Prevotella sp.]